MYKKVIFSDLKFNHYTIFNETDRPIKVVQANFYYQSTKPI